MFKNVASQKLTVFAFADAGHASLDAGEPVTGDAANITGQISKDDGAPAASDDTNPTEIDATDHPGMYRFNLTQAETNCDKIEFTAKSSTAGVQLVALPSAVIYTRPQYFSDLGIESDGHAHADVKQWLGTTPLGLSNQMVQVDLTGIHGTALTETAGQLAGRFVDFFDQSSASFSVATALADFKATGFLTSLGANAPAGWINAAAIAVSALDGKGDWSTHDAAAVLSALGNGSWATEAGGTGDQFTGIPLHADLQDGGRIDLILDELTTQGDTNEGKIDTAQADLNIVTGADGVTLATVQGNYAPSKAGDAMTLTAGERTTLAAAIEAAIINELDGNAVMQAIADLIADDMTTGDLSVQAIASAVRDAILNRALAGNHDTAGTPGKLLQDVHADTNELQTNQGDWATATTVDLNPDQSGVTIGTVSTVTNAVTTDAESRIASKADVSALALEASLDDIKGTGFVKDTHSLIDITEDVTGLDGEAMRGTDFAYTGTPPTTEQIKTKLEEDGGKLDVLYDDWQDDGRLDSLLDTAANGGDATEANQSTMLGLLQNATYGLSKLARTGGDGDTLETLSEQLDSLTSLSGEGAYTGTLTVESSGGTPLEGVVVNARRGGVLKASGTTDSNGQITDWVFGPYTYSVAARIGGYQSSTTSITFSEDGWAETITMTLLDVTLPDNPTLATGVLLALTSAGAADTSASATIKMIEGPGTSGYAYDNTPWTESANGSGIIQFVGIIPGAHYEIYLGSDTDRKVFFKAPTSSAGSSFNIDEVIGS